MDYYHDNNDKSEISNNLKEMVCFTSFWKQDHRILKIWLQTSCNLILYDEESLRGPFYLIFKLIFRCTTR
jgi:hypothetical protein